MDYTAAFVLLFLNALVIASVFTAAKDFVLGIKPFRNALAVGLLLPIASRLTYLYVTHGVVGLLTNQP